MSKNLSSFNGFNDEQSENYLAAHLPSGKIYDRKLENDSIIYKLLLCLATFIKMASGQIFDIAKNTNIDKADFLLEEWETSVNIP